jgi:hypothetical protein
VLGGADVVDVELEPVVLGGADVVVDVELDACFGQRYLVQGIRGLLEL